MTSRITWQPKIGQRWHRLDMNPVDSAAWLNGLRYYAKRGSISISKEPPRRRVDFVNPLIASTGIILGFSNEDWSDQIDWLLRFRQSEPNCIVIGWVPQLEFTLLPLILEAGVSLIATGYHQLLPCAEAAIRKGRQFPIEDDPILMQIQQALSATLSQRTALRLDPLCVYNRT